MATFPLLGWAFGYSARSLRKLSGYGSVPTHHATLDGQANGEWLESFSSCTWSARLHSSRWITVGAALSRRCRNFGVRMGDQYDVVVAEDVVVPVEQVVQACEVLADQLAVRTSEEETAAEQSWRRPSGRA